MSTDQNSLESMLDNEPNEQAAPSPAPQAETGVTSTAPPADAPVQQTRDDEGPVVPRKALEDERRKRQEIERQLAALGQQRQQPQQQQPQHVLPQEAPDPFVDPQGYAQFIAAHAAVQAREQAEFAALNREVNRSERRARKAHGDDVVDKALEAAHRAGVNLQFAQADDPYEELVKWHSDYQIASDPASYRERLRAEVLAEYGIQPGQAQPQRQRAPVPKSLASTASAQPRNERGQFQGPRPLEDLLG